MTFALIAYQMSKSHPDLAFPTAPTREDKEAICTCFGLLDELNESEEDAVILSDQEMSAYQRRIMQCTQDEYPALQAELTSAKELALCNAMLRKIEAKTMGGIPLLSSKKIDEYKGRILKNAGLSLLHQELSALHHCILLLEDIRQEAIGGEHDDEMNRYIERIKTSFNVEIPMIDEIENDLQNALDGVASEEMQSVKREIDRLYRDAKKTRTWDKKGMNTKAAAIETALRAVPIEERLHVFTYKSDTCHAVRKALASNRLRNKGREVDKDTDEIIEKKAAKAFTWLKEKHGDILKALKNDDDKQTASLTASDDSSRLGRG